MKINSILIRNIRNISEKEINFGDKNLILGNNGTGKTSLLESAYITLTGKSFRTNNLTEAIKKGCQHAFIKAEIEDELDFKRTIAVGFDGKDKNISMDEKRIERKELLSIVSAVKYSPEDMEIVKGSPKKRRDYIDRVAFICERNYLVVMLDYSRYLKQKSLLLKKQDRKTLKHLNKAVIPVMENIRATRSAVARLLNDKLVEISEEMGYSFSAELEFPAVSDDEKKMNDKMEKEIERGYALFGPHVDDMIIKIDSMNLKSVSMGELNFFAVILKFAELRLYSEKGIYPVFLADEALSYVDNKRKSLLISWCDQMKNQAVLTSHSGFSAHDFENWSKIVMD